MKERSSSHPTPTNKSSARVTLSLDGQWNVGESLEGTAVPRDFPSRCQVPGLVRLAQPPFPHVDEFESCELNQNLIRHGTLPESARVAPPGRSTQPRNYFWYRTTFRAPAGYTSGWLTIEKAQFGMGVWLNGRALGTEPACFSSGRFELTEALRWDAENELVVRVGAHPGVLPASYPAGSDFEKFQWTPGIYDSVSVAFCNNPVVTSVQVAPRVDPRAIVVQTKLANRSGKACTAQLAQRISEWRGGAQVAEAAAQSVRLAAGETITITQTIALPGGRLWSPEDPFLYVLETSTGGDAVTTRFGLREFRSDSKTGKFYLNGESCFLRGSNIALHRFFEDKQCGALPWDEAWVRKLLAEIPRQLNWNAFRFSIGPVPQRWFEIADECGLLIQNEFFVWTSHPKWHAPQYGRTWDADELIRQYGAWMSDHWNHPSVVIWDACNETFDPVFGEKVIPAVRGLDLSNRPWDNGYNQPAAPDDPVEIHPYFHAASHWENKLLFDLSELETKTPEEVIKLGSAEENWHGNPLIINEYGWLWLHRDGTPSSLAERVYPMMLGANASAEDRFAHYAYDIAAETEFFRSSRRFAGVLHFSYLTESHHGGYTSDPFRDIRALKLDPYFADYASEAFKPLGVFLKFLHSTLTAGARTFVVNLVNDYAHAVQGRVVLTLETEKGEILARAEKTFALAAFGDGAVDLACTIPERLGHYLLKATASINQSAKPAAAPTVGRRKVEVVAQKSAAI
ncbi:MAG TPA: glycoside hydrolase family 2 TIM barrel-domain containing protein [Opitutaceae bacterium]|nr:glycoside hydrolase family 2 TIM barrel-domain containing protein [Opitutaceae bacterium]